MERICKNCKYYLTYDELNKEQKRIFRIFAEASYLYNPEKGCGLCNDYEIPKLVCEDDVCSNFKPKEVGSSG